MRDEQYSSDHVSARPTSAVPGAIVLMGVCGCGKTEVGHQLAALTGGVYHDGDDYHSTENVAKMGRGTPLDDADRWPWLRLLRDEVIAPAIDAGGGGAPAPRLPVILGCSALRRSYREALIDGLPRGSVWFVYLHGSWELILERMGARQGHYMKEEMVASQFAILEVPGDDESAIRVDIAPAPEVIAGDILSMLALR